MNRSLPLLALPLLALPLLALLLVATVSPALANEASGTYEVRGRGPEGSYRGEARVLEGPKGLELVIRRGEERLRGALRPCPAGYVFRVEGKPGITGALSGTSSPFVHETRYRVRDGVWTGLWRTQRGGVTTATGRERFRRGELPTLRLAISVDWEGRDLSDANLAAIERFRARFPRVPLTHFLNAAYYVKGAGASDTSQDAAITASIRRALRPGDELGLHLHGWRSLVEAAGVPFRSAPSFWGAGKPLHASHGDEGHEVEIAAYAPKDLASILSYSKRVLRERGGFSIGTSFRAGGWIAPRSVLEAVSAAGFRVDASSVPPTWHDELGDMALRGRLAELWRHVTPDTQPSLVATAKGTLVEMPDTGALADYVTTREMSEHVRAALKRQRETKEAEVYVHLGFHLETAARYLPRLEAALEALFADADPRLVIETLAASAARARERLEATKRADEAYRKQRKERGGLPLPELQLDDR